MKRLNFALGTIVIFYCLKVCVDEAIEVRIIAGIIVNVFFFFFLLKTGR